MSTDRDAMYAYCESAPGDLAMYGALADELDSLGYPVLAHAFRWMAFRGKWPHKRERYTASYGYGRTVPKNHRWAWYIESSIRHETPIKIHNRVPLKRHSLPRLLLNGEQKVFATHQQAVMFLAAQLKLLQQAHEAHATEKPGIGDGSAYMGEVLRDAPLIETLGDDREQPEFDATDFLADN